MTWIARGAGSVVSRPDWITERSLRRQIIGVADVIRVIRVIGFFL